MSATARPGATVVVPYYNHSRYLADCLSSIRNQTYPDWNVILVDDASTDSEAMHAVVDRLEMPRLRIIRHEVNRGLAAARNTGFRESTTEFMVSLDSDDKLAPEYLERLVPVIVADETLDCVFSDCGAFHNRKLVYEFHVPKSGEIYRQQTVPGSGTLMRRRLWERVGGYDEASILRNGREDWEYWIRAFTQGCRAAHVPGPPLYIVRVSNSSMSALCRLEDYAVAQYIYRKHRRAFDRAGARRAFMDLAVQRALRASQAKGLRRRAALMALRAFRLQPSIRRLKTVVRTMLPASIILKLRASGQNAE